MNDTSSHRPAQTIGIVSESLLGIDGRLYLRTPATETHPEGKSRNDRDAWSAIETEEGEEEEGSRRCRQQHGPMPTASAKITRGEAQRRRQHGNPAQAEGLNRRRVIHPKLGSTSRPHEKR